MNSCGFWRVWSSSLWVCMCFWVPLRLFYPTHIALPRAHWFGKSVQKLVWFDLLIKIIKSKASVNPSFLSFISKLFIMRMHGISLVGSWDNNSLYGYSAWYILFSNFNELFMISACSFCLVGSGRCVFLQSLQLEHLVHLLMGWILMLSVLISFNNTSFCSDHLEIEEKFVQFTNPEGGASIAAARCLEFLKVDISAGALRMTALIYCHFQCSRGNVLWDFSAGTLKLTVNQCCHSQCSRGEVRPIFIYKGMKAR